MPDPMIAYCGPAAVPDDFWTRWNVDPLLIACLAALALMIARGRSGNTRAGWLAVVLLAAVFISPLCALSSALFSARVLHHVVLVAGVAPLLALPFPRHRAGPLPLAVLVAAHAAILKDGFTTDTSQELFRAAHDIKGDAATFGFPTAGAAAESLCRIIEHAPNLERVPAELIAHHINAIQAIVRENAGITNAGMAAALSKKLRGVADEYLAAVNRDRPEHLEAILAPSIVPGD